MTVLAEPACEDDGWLCVLVIPSIILTMVKDFHPPCYDLLQ
jgi:hypothetical protein